MCFSVDWEERGRGRRGPLQGAGVVEGQCRLERAAAAQGCHQGVAACLQYDDRDGTAA